METFKEVDNSVIEPKEVEQEPVVEVEEVIEPLVESLEEEETPTEPKEEDTYDKDFQEAVDKLANAKAAKIVSSKIATYKRELAAEMASELAKDLVAKAEAERDEAFNQVNQIEIEKFSLELESKGFEGAGEILSASGKKGEDLKTFVKLLSSKMPKDVKSNDFNDLNKKFEGEKVDLTPQERAKALAQALGQKRNSSGE